MSSNTAIRDAFSQQLLAALSDVIAASTYFIFMWHYSRSLTIFVAIVALLQDGITVASLHIIKPLIAREMYTQIQAQSYNMSVVNGIEAIKTSVAECSVQGRWKRLFNESIEASIARDRTSAFLSAISSILNIGAPLTTLVFGSMLVLNGRLTTGQMLAFSALTGAFLAPAISLISNQTWQNLGLHLDRLDDVFDSPLEGDGQRSVAPRLTGDIDMHNVSFRYSSQGPLVLSGINVHIPSGSKVVIVGTTGSGKSTLLRLLSGVTTPSSGTILYDRIDLQSLDLQSVRRQIAYVSQNRFLFNDTVRANIALADSETSILNVEWAANMAEISAEIAAMPNGFDTVLSEYGRDLSGGQRQRLCIARALVNRPSILMLDEATSEIDGQTEARIHSNLSQLECTQLAVAHRLAVAREADLILVLDHGKLIEHGRHAELIELNGKYRAMWAEANIDARVATSSTSTSSLHAGEISPSHVRIPVRLT